MEVYEVDKVVVRVVNMEKIWSACESMPPSVCVHLSAPVCVHVRACTRQKVPGLLRTVTVPAGRVAVRMALFPVSAPK